jgi:hypothetical protein
MGSVSSVIVERAYHVAGERILNFSDATTQAIRVVEPFLAAQPIQVVLVPDEGGQIIEEL